MKTEQNHVYPLPSKTAKLPPAPPSASYLLPATGFLRIHHIVGDAKKGITGVFPVSRSHWYEGVKKGIYPQPVQLGGARCVAWRVEDIQALIDAQQKRSA